MTAEKVEYLQSRLQNHLSRGAIREGLVFITHELRSLFHEFSPAHILLIMHVFFIIICGIVLTLFLHFGSYSVNAWGREKQWKLLEIVVYGITGLWIIEKMFLGLLYINTNLPHWAVAICACLCMVFFLLYMLD